MPAHFDDTQWPVIILRIEGADKPADIEAMLSGITRRMMRGRCAIVFDTLGSAYPSLSEAQVFARMEGSWLLKNQLLIKDNVVGVAFIISNPAIRFILTSVLLIAALPTAHTVCADPNEGRLYCVEQLRSASLGPARKIK